MNLYENLKIIGSQMQLKDFEESLQFYETESDKKLMSQRKWVLDGLVADKNILATFYYILGQHDKTKIMAQGTVDDVMEYFFGKWRNTPQQGEPDVYDDEKALGITKPYGDRFFKGRFGFIEEYFDAVNFAGILNDWKSVKKLSEYPDESVKAPGGENDQHIYYCYFISQYLKQGNKLTGCDKYYEKIQSTRGKKYKLLAEMIINIDNNDSDAFNHNLNEYLKYYKSKVFNTNLPKMLATYASFMINFAKHQGLNVEYNSRFEDYIIKL